MPETIQERKHKIDIVLRCIQELSGADAYLFKWYDIEIDNFIWISNKNVEILRNRYLEALVSCYKILQRLEQEINNNE
jgi:hypothetical protein